MKFKYSALLLVLISSFAFAQTVYIGPRIMFNYSFPSISNEAKKLPSTTQVTKLSNGDSVSSEFSKQTFRDMKAAPGFSIGFQTDFKLTENIGLVANVNAFDYKVFKENKDVSLIKNTYKYVKGKQTTTKVDSLSSLTSTSEEYTYKYTFVSLDLLFKYTIKNFNIMCGPSILFNVANTVSGGSSDVDDNHALSPVLDLKFGLGYDYELSDNLKISPEVNFSVPLTNAREEDDYNLKIQNLQAGVVLKYAL